MTKSLPQQSLPQSSAHMPMNRTNSSSLSPQSPSRRPRGRGRVQQSLKRSSSRGDAAFAQAAAAAAAGGSPGGGAAGASLSPGGSTGHDGGGQQSGGSRRRGRRRARPRPDRLLDRTVSSPLMRSPPRGDGRGFDGTSLPPTHASPSSPRSRSLSPTSSAASPNYSRRRRSESSSSVLSDDDFFEPSFDLPPLPLSPPLSGNNRRGSLVGGGGGLGAGAGKRASLVVIGEERDGMDHADGAPYYHDGPRDPVGDALWRMLNDTGGVVGRAFRYSEDSDGSGVAAPSSAEGEAWTGNHSKEQSDVAAAAAAGTDLNEGQRKSEFHPLLSSYNIFLVRDLFRQCVESASGLVWDDAASRERRKGGEAAATAATRPSLLKTLKSTAAFLAVATILLSAPTTVVVLLSVRTLLLTLAFAASVLFDYQEVEAVVSRKCPWWLKEVAALGWQFVTDLVVWVWTLVDWHLLLGWEYVGRVGDDGRRGSSKAGGTATDGMARSEATDAHLAALSFCDSVVSKSARFVREDKLKASKRSSVIKKAKSRSEVGTGTKARGGGVGADAMDDERRGREGSRRRKRRTAAIVATPTTPFDGDGESGGSIQRSNSWSHSLPYPPSESAEKMESTMPNGDDLLRQLIDEDGTEAYYSDCVESPATVQHHVLPKGSLPDDDDGDEEEAIEVVRQHLGCKNRPQCKSTDSAYSLRSNPTLEELLAAEDGNNVHGDASSAQYSSQEYWSSDDHDERSTEFLSGLASYDLSYGSGEQSCDDSSSMPSSARSTIGAEREVNWIDVGAKIGIRLLNNEKVQMVMADPAKAERLFGASGRGRGRESGLDSLPDASEGGLSFAGSPDRTLVTAGGAKPRAAFDTSSPLRGAGSPVAGVAPPNTPMAATEGAGTERGLLESAKRTQPQLGMVISPPKPMHAMWTSPGAAATRRHSSMESIGTTEEEGEDDGRSTEIFAGGAPTTTDSKAGASETIEGEDDLIIDHTTSKGSGRGVARTMIRDDPLLHAPLLPTMSDKENDTVVLRNVEDTGMEIAMRASLDMVRPCPQSVVPLVKGASADEPTVTASLEVDKSVSLTDFRECDSAVNKSGSPSTHGARAQGRTRRRSEVSSLQPPPQRRPAILPGVKMVVPIIPIQPQGRGAGRTSGRRHSYDPTLYQMATVLSSERIYVPSGFQSDVPEAPARFSRSTGENEIAQALLKQTNCISIKVLLDKSFLRDGKFAEMTLRVLDEWRGKQYMPRHSKFPIGSCVATSFGIGVLVAWRVEDDCHVIRSLWQKRGDGSAMAYLNRDALNGVVEAGVGFKVQTTFGKGEVVSYVNGGTDFLRGEFGVRIKQHGQYSETVVDLPRNVILSCVASRFIPVLEQIKEAAQYRIQLEQYEMAMRQRYLLENESPSKDKELWNVFEDGIELMVSSFLKAVSEDQNFDEGMTEFLTTIIDFLEQLDFDDGGKDKKKKEALAETENSVLDDDGGSAIFVTPSDNEAVAAGRENANTKEAAGSWIMKDFFGGMFKKTPDTSILDTSTVVTNLSVQSELDALIAKRTSKTYDKIYAIIRTMLHTVAIARASVPDRPNLQMGLTTVHDVLLFVRTVIKVQQANMSPESVKAWKCTFRDFVSTFGPMKERLTKLGTRIAERLEKHGKKAKHRMLRFVDIVLADEDFLQGLEMLDWPQCIYRLEYAAVKAKIIDAESCAQYHKTALFVYNTLAPRAGGSEGAAARNEEKLANLAKALKLMASPHRTLLKLLMRDDVMELLERLFVRVFQKDVEASQMLNIFAFNFHSFRHLRVLKDMSISGRLWRPLLDAADEEFSLVVAKIPDNAKVYIEPVSKLFSLGVARFHSIRSGDLRSDWLDFLMEKEAVKIIQELDMKLMLSLEGLCKDVKEAMQVMPYYSSIDDDILNLIDEVEIKKFLKESAEALVDADRFALFLRDKISVAVARFLDYLPKMSIPIERRELGEGWVLTCRGRDGDPLTLSDVIVKQENLTCEILGGENILSPVFKDKLQSLKGKSNPPSLYGAPSSTDEDDADETESVQVSVLNDVAVLIRNAQSYGCWKSGRGGVKEIKNDIDPALNGLPVSEVLRSAIDLWQNLEIDDEELMEIAIRDVSYQITLQKDDAAESKEVEKRSDESSWRETSAVQLQQDGSTESDMSFNLEQDPSHPQPFLSANGVSGFRKLGRRRFNPRKDPTLLYLEMKKLTCHLDEFLFRIEPMERSTIFDPVFEGLGSLTIKNVSIKLRLECRKERINKLDTEVFVPVLQLQGPCEIVLEKVKFKFKETGADWLLNNLVKGFRDIISEVVESKVKEQIVTQIEEALDNLNGYLAVNPDLLLTVLGITIDDLEENVVFV